MLLSTIFGATALATVGVVIGVTLIVLFVVADWMIFTKAGEKGWKSIIPIYNLYILFKITWKKSMFWVCLLLSIVFGIVHSLYFVSKTGIVYPIVLVVLVIAMLVFYIMALNKIAKSFGHSGGYTVLLVFFPNIMTLVLGFGHDCYIGPEGISKQE